MPYHPGKFTWFDHVSGDSAKARQFYEALFGWSVKRVAGSAPPYDMIHNGEQGIAGLVSAPAGVPSHWASYVSVGDVDAIFDSAIAAGAKPLMPPRDFARAGRGATVLDPTGAAVSLWKSLQGDRDDARNAPPGDWVWNELATPDVPAALSFYRRVFGYSHEEMDMGGQGKYCILKSSDGHARGGIMKSPAGMPTMWLPYVKVEDAGKTAARVAPLGGKLLGAPREIAKVGHVATLIDPAGAALAFIQPAVMA